MRPLTRLRVATWLLMGRHVFVQIRPEVTSIASLSCSGPMDIEQIKIRFSTYQHLYLGDSGCWERFWALGRVHS